MTKRSKTARRGRRRGHTQRRRRTYRRGGGGDTPWAASAPSAEEVDGSYARHKTPYADEYDEKARTFFGDRIIFDQPAIKQYLKLKSTLGSSKDAYEEMQRRALSQYY